jgi:uncharacterized protein (TIGR00299 family) protein
MTVAWFQCESGAAGDMLLAALVDAGAPLDEVWAAVAAVGVEPISISVEPVLRGGLAALRAHVVPPAHDPPMRTWADIRRLLLEADGLAGAVRERALDVFGRLARAEAAAHRSTPEAVHFHEVGALDAVADVVGVCAALHALGIVDAHATSIAVGQGTVGSAHGVLPVPAPAVVSLLAEVGAPVHSGDRSGELCTPTGAALLAATVTRWGGLPPGRVVSAGYGAGSRELSGIPNVLRVVLLDPLGADGADGAGTTREEVVVDTNVDDLDPRLWPAVLGRLIEAGASDAWLTPVIMKKGRPAHTLSVLVQPAHLEAVRRVVFAETSAIGLREHVVGKRFLDRETATVVVDGHELRVKVARLDGVVVNVQPEYDDVAAAAERTGRPLKAVLADAVAQARTLGVSP